MDDWKRKDERRRSEKRDEKRFELKNHGKLANAKCDGAAARLSSVRSGKDQSDGRDEDDGCNAIRRMQRKGGGMQQEEEGSKDATAT